jgi:hypothetical protein
MHAIPLKIRMLRDPNDQFEVAAFRTWLARVAFAGQQKAQARVRASGNVDFNRSSCLDATITPARAAWVGDDRSLAITARARLPQFKEPLSLDKLAAPSTLDARGAFTAFGPLAAAISTSLKAANLDVGFDFLDEVVKLDIDNLSPVAAALRTAAASTLLPAATHEGAEKIADNISKGGTCGAELSRFAIHARMSISVVAGTLFFVSENFVSFRGFFEPLRGLGIADVTIGMIEPGKSLVRPLDFLDCGGPLHFKYFVIVALTRHR